MSAIQTVDRVNFGVGRLFEIAAGGFPLPVGNLTDASVDFTVDNKEAYGEGGYAVFSADGHRQIKISAKHYSMNPSLMANALGGTITTGATGQVLDEVASVPALTPYTYQLNGHTDYIDKTIVILAFPLTGGVAVPTQYAIVDSGSEVAGVSASVSSSGTITFAAGDAGIGFQASYQKTVSGGTKVAVVNTFQNSGKFYQLFLTKRDISPVDNSTALTNYFFYAARGAGMKAGYPEGNYTVYERMYTAFQDSAGRVVDVSFANE